MRREGAETCAISCMFLLQPPQESRKQFFLMQCYLNTETNIWFHHCLSPKFLTPECNFIFKGRHSIGICSPDRQRQNCNIHVRVRACVCVCVCVCVYRVIRNDCRGFNNLSFTIHLSEECTCMYFFYLIEQHSKFLLHTLQVLYMCTLCDSTNVLCAYKCKHTKHFLTAVRRNLSKVRSKRRNV